MKPGIRQRITLELVTEEPLTPKQWRQATMAAISGAKCISVEIIPDGEEGKNADPIQ